MASPNTLPMRPRLAATLALIPAVIFLWYVAAASVASAAYGGGYAGGTPPSSAEVLVSAFVVYSGPFPFLYLGILAIWWRTVRWTSRRLIGIVSISAMVIVAAAAATLIALAGGGFETTLVLSSAGFNCVFGPGLLALVAWICYPTPTERGEDGLRCPRCHYDLRGQRECRCPECGLEFSIGDLAKADNG